MEIDFYHFKCMQCTMYVGSVMLFAIVFVHLKKGKLKLIWKSIRKVNGKALILKKYFNWYNWSNSFQLSILKQKIYVKIWYNQFKSLQFRNLPFLIFSFRKHVIASGFNIGSRKKNPKWLSRFTLFCEHWSRLFSINGPRTWDCLAQ